MGAAVFLLLSSSFSFFGCPSVVDICKKLSLGEEVTKCVEAAKSLNQASKTRNEMCDKIACSKRPTYVLNCVSAKLTPESEARCSHFTRAGRYKAANICLDKLNGAKEDQISETQFRKCLPLTQFNEGRQDSDNDGSNFQRCMESVVEQPAQQSPAPAPATPEIRFQN